MKNQIYEQEYYNEFWDTISAPFFTIITPVYNRRETIERTIISVEKQSFRDLEYIIIDDGSSVSSDDIIKDYMAKSTLPVLYLKKENGGVHTARNLGYKYARGKLTICIDSDDELTENACKSFYNAWLSIPNGRKKEYWQIKALCVDQNGKLCSKRFPKNINLMSKEEAVLHFSMAKGEQLGCRVTKVLKENHFPEPRGVKFVNECVLWYPMEKKYRSWGINDVVRVYHTEGNDHLSGHMRKNIQSCRNAYWNSTYEINHPELFYKNWKNYCLTMTRHCVMYNLLKDEDKDFLDGYRLIGKKNLLVRSIFWLPGKIASMLYRKRKMS